MALKSVDPNTPSILFQSVPTLNSLDYRLTFDAFTTDADKGQQNLTVDFGVGTWAVQPPGHWLFYTFSVRGKGSDDVLKFSAWDTSGGAVYIYNLALVSLGSVPQHLFLGFVPCSLPSAAWITRLRPHNQARITRLRPYNQARIARLHPHKQARQQRYQTAGLPSSPP
jgi:hypothetical protein